MSPNSVNHRVVKKTSVMLTWLFWTRILVLEALEKILGTTAVRNLKQFESTCELKRVYVLRDFRQLGMGQQLLDIAIDFAKSVGYSRIVLDSSKALHVARTLYLKNGFIDIPKYNDNYRADVFMERRLVW